MRRSVLSAVLAVSLSLVACSDQPTEVPSRPEVVPSRPAPLVSGSCTLADVLRLTSPLLPPGPVRTAILALINKLPPNLPQRQSVAAKRAMILIVDALLKAFYAGKLYGGTSATTFDNVLRLIEALHCYVGLTPPSLPTTTTGGAGSDAVVRVVLPGVAATVCTPSGNGALFVSNTSVTAAMGPVTIVIYDLDDSPPPLHTSLAQYPRFYHYSGVMASGTVEFATAVTAAISPRTAFPNEVIPNLRLAHNVGENFGQVEVLPAPAALPVCPTTGALRAGEPGRFDWAKKLIFPAELHAASVALYELPPVGGTTKRFSEFGIVDQTSNPARLSIVDGSGEPAGGTVSGASTVFVKATNPVSGKPIRRVPVSFGETTVLTGDDGMASFEWDATPGTSLTATVPNESNEVGPTCPSGIPAPSPTGGYRPLVCFTPNSVTFTAPAADLQLVLNVTSVEKLPGGTQHFVVQSGGAGPYIWSVNGVDGGNATFGLIATNEDFTADYTAPASVPEPATFNVCARRMASPSNVACALVTIQPVPSSGADIIVFNDVNIFDQTAALNANNIQLFKNLLNFTTTGARNTVNGVLIHRGHGSLCGPAATPDAGCVWTTFEATLAGEGSTVVDGDDITTPLTSIGASVKLIVLVVPMDPYSTAEVNSLKSFAGQGGRILFVGEHENFYGSVGIALENNFLTQMGAVMRNTGGAVDCGRNVLPSTSLRAHQITVGLTQLAMACASVVEPGPNDYALFYALNGTQVLGAVAKIDLTPLAGLRVATPARVERSSALPTKGVRGIDVFSWGYSPKE